MGLSEESIPGFPMETSTKDNTGEVISFTQFVSASNSNFSDADFKVPAEYKNAEDLFTAPASK